MSEKLIFLLHKLIHKTWVRCALFSLVAVVAVALSMRLGPVIPEDVAVKLGADAIGSLLTILATSMLQDAFLPLARYGARAVEVGCALQRALVSIQRQNHTAFNRTLNEISDYAIAQAVHADMLDCDVQRLREAAMQLIGQEPTYAENR